MKLLKFLFILSAFQAFSQNVELTEEKLTNTLCKNWKIDYIMMGNTKAPNTPAFAAEEFRFTLDHTYSFKSGKEGEAKTKWVYNKQEKCVELFSGEKIIGKIISLDDTHLVYRPLFDNQTQNMTVIELHFMPVNN
jgi:hypothetical protein